MTVFAFFTYLLTYLLTAELGPNWLEITTGRARTDEEEVGGAQEEGEGC